MAKGAGPVAQDLRSALEALEAAGELWRVDAPIDRDFEAAAVLWEVKAGN